MSFSFTVTGSTAYVFSRDQLLRALEAHQQTLPPEAAERLQTTVLGFLDGPAAKAEGLVFTPPPIQIA